jgi:hypothetical protein
MNCRFDRTNPFPSCAPSCLGLFVPVLMLCSSMRAQNFDTVPDMEGVAGGTQHQGTPPPGRVM